MRRAPQLPDPQVPKEHMPPSVFHGAKGSGQRNLRQYQIYGNYSFFTFHRNFLLIVFYLVFLKINLIFIKLQKFTAGDCEFSNAQQGVW